MYNAFRVFAAFRAKEGAKQLQKAMTAVPTSIEGEKTKSPEVCLVFHADAKFQDAIEEETALVAKEIGIERDHRENAGVLLKQDMHDDVVARMESRLQLRELVRTYRRARMEYFLYHGQQDQPKQRLEIV